MLSARRGTGSAARKRTGKASTTVLLIGGGLVTLMALYVLWSTQDEEAYLSKLLTNNESSSQIDKENIEQQKEPVLQQQTVTSWVKCGGHSAQTCDLCPQGNGASWCNGDCTWCDAKKQCIPLSEKDDPSCKPVQAEQQKSGMLWKPPDPEPWFVPPNKDYGLTLSIVLPCGYEHEFFERTIQSVFAATPSNILQEIIVVDDNSNPPLEPLMTINAQDYKVKFLRSDVTLGLMDAKHQGAKIATGDIVVFFDCHVKPALGYWEPFVREIAADPKRVVVPTITALDIDTWEESGRPTGNAGGMSKCYLTFDSEFKWTSDETPWIPIMSGGLLALRRDWFFEVGGHDPEMKGWGGENLDLSLRIWRCGGSIVSAPKSYVAHMWRVGGKTRAKYTIEGSPIQNRARAIKAHAPEFFGNKTVYFPPFIKWKDKDNLNVDSIQNPLKNLQCHDFLWYLNRFAYIYRDAGYIPSRVFQLTPDGGKLCLSLGRDHWGTASTPNDDLKLKPCSSIDGRQATSGTQYWHKSNRNNAGKCCSGLRAWNTDQCMLGGLKSGICSMNNNQPARFDESSGHLVVAGRCLSFDKETNSLSQALCSDDTTTWQIWKPFEPQEFSLLNPEMRKSWN
jgi:polypeptide N-acetylgalactosaminyltransferase